MVLSEFFSTTTTTKMESPKKIPSPVKLNMDTIFTGNNGNGNGTCRSLLASFNSNINCNNNISNNSNYSTTTPTKRFASACNISNNNNNNCATVTISSPSSKQSAQSPSSIFLGSLNSASRNAGTFIPPGILNSPTNSHSSQPSNVSSSASNLLNLSPSKPRYSDRFIPARAGNTWNLTYPTPPTAHSPESARPLTPHKRIKDNSENCNKEGSALYSCLLMNEVLGYHFEDNKQLTPGVRKVSPNRRLFNYDATDRSVVLSGPWSPYSVSPISHKSEKLLRSPKKPTRRISKVPFKVLDAPELQDDFYLNLVDWSSQNVLSVGLGTCVYLWSACTSQVTRLCDLAQTSDTVTSVAWNEKGNFVAVGTQGGLVQIWDAAAGKQVQSFPGHTARVGALAWNGELLSSGSRDRFINQKDIREPPQIQERQLVGHRQEVCGLKWSPDNQCLASGGNDNRLYVWDLRVNLPIQQYTEHVAAVKAIAWSPHHHGLLASGGGTADRCIRFWNTLTAQPMQSIDTGSQVCNLAWSKHSAELVSTHGYSQNQVLVWKYPSLQQVAKLTGHSYRVLYLAMSPDGEAIVTGAGDETLRFWNVFSKNRTQKENKSSLNLYTSIR